MSSTSLPEFTNLTDFCNDKCEDLSCPGCSVSPGLYLITHNNYGNIQQCSSFLSTYPILNLTRLDIALMLSYAIIATSTIALIVTIRFPVLFSLVAFCESVLSLAVFLLVTSNGGFAEMFQSLVTSGCYNEATMIQLVGISTSLASATVLAGVSIGVEWIEVLELCDTSNLRGEVKLRDEAEGCRSVLFRPRGEGLKITTLALAILAIVVSVFEMISFRGILQPIAQIVSRIEDFSSQVSVFNNSLGVVSNDPKVLRFDLPNSKFVHTLQLNRDDANIALILDYYNIVNHTSSKSPMNSDDSCNFRRHPFDQYSMKVNTRKYGHFGDVIRCDWGIAILGDPENPAEPAEVIFNDGTYKTISNARYLNCDTKEIIIVVTASNITYQIPAAKTPTDPFVPTGMDFSYTFEFVDVRTLQVTKSFTTQLLGNGASENAVCMSCSAYDVQRSFCGFQSVKFFPCNGESGICFTLPQHRNLEGYVYSFVSSGKTYYMCRFRYNTFDTIFRILSSGAGIQQMQQILQGGAFGGNSSYEVTASTAITYKNSVSKYYLYDTFSGNQITYPFSTGDRLTLGFNGGAILGSAQDQTYPAIIASGSNCGGWSLVEAYQRRNPDEKYDYTYNNLVYTFRFIIEHSTGQVRNTSYALPATLKDSSVKITLGSQPTFYVYDKEKTEVVLLGSVYHSRSGIIAADCKILIAVFVAVRILID
jgi:hypothetical protein